MCVMQKKNGCRVSEATTNSRRTSPIAIASKEQGSERDERGNELRAITELDAYTATVAAASSYEKLENILVANPISLPCTIIAELLN